METKINQFFEYLSFLGNPENKIEVNALERFMTPTCLIESNGSTLSQESDDFINYIAHMQEKYEKVSYSYISKDSLIKKSSASLHFKVECLEKKGTVRLLDAKANLTFKEGKIDSWIETFYDTFPHSYQEVNLSRPLYPIQSPLEEGYLKVSDIHTLFYATYGNPKGIPVVVLHGGPGEGTSDLLTQFFDLSLYYVVMFDQRGSHRSIPFGCLEENNPENSVSDIERLRKHLGIKKWLVFGGSWGSTLALLYGQKHPDLCLGFVLRGVFLGREKDSLHLLYGMGDLSPKAYQKFVDYVPLKERGDLLNFYYQQVMDPDLNISLPAAHSFIEFDATCAHFKSTPATLNATLSNSKAIYSVAKHFLYYAKNHFFLDTNQIISQMDKIQHLPALIIHGKYDIVTLPENAYTLFDHWESSMLWMVSQGGHTSKEPDIAAALAEALDLFAKKINGELKDSLFF